MADIFLSYAREDQQRAGLLADALAASFSAIPIAPLKGISYLSVASLPLRDPLGGYPWARQGIELFEV